MDSPPPDVAGAAPAVASDLHMIGWLRHASILEEELSSALDVLDDLILATEEKKLQQIGAWLQDVRYVTLAAHFATVHRSNQDG